METHMLENGKRIKSTDKELKHTQMEEKTLGNGKKTNLLNKIKK